MRERARVGGRHRRGRKALLRSARHHPDLYWAARGSGPGFFGVVTSFTLRLHRRPAVLGTCLYMYPIEVADEVFSWGRSISGEIDDRVELQILTSRNAPEVGPDVPAIAIASPVFADSDDEAAKALAILGTCPVIDRAIANLAYMPTTLANWYAAVMMKYPAAHRYSVDNMFTSASAEELLPGIRGIIETLPPHPSHFVFAGWKPSADRAEMVYGVEDEIYLALTPPGAIRPTTNATATGPVPTWRRCRIWRPASRWPTRISPGARPRSSPSRTWPAWTAARRLRPGRNVPQLDGQL